ncbi:DUF4342 domain-containing protein [Alphaproteobacteria bacterium GH1-50]|uniref:DUF4342 domain-containing protein n=1 Tax=Kangsaoukella pontilimi TaxID=2691042 RepID=A0A7C9IFI1_9RHOB|nr:DUF4342 domain-containing protein [Kangsaoukella pontilimi]MXQ07269.1 DUF4342 domain-containing protein [Kangsaoukella pontilimi]
MTDQDTDKPADAPETRDSWTKEIEVAGEELIRRVKQLAADSHVKRIRVVEPDGDIALEIPLAYGAIAGGAVVIATPVLAVLGALAALVAKVKIEIIEEEPEKTPDT